MIKVLIFDFDGTITDSVDIKTQAFATLYKPYGKDIANKVVEYHLSHGGISRFDKFRYFHKEFLNKELSEKKIQDLAKRFSVIVIDKVVRAPYIPGAFEFITKNYKTFNMFISTATPTNEIVKILQRKKLIKYFKKVYGSPESKIKHVRNIISKNNYLKNELMFIGDSKSDEEAANANGIRFIKVAYEQQLIKNSYHINNFNEFEKLLKI